MSFSIDKNPAPQSTNIPIDHGRISLFHPVLNVSDTNICELLKSKLKWRQDHINVHGKSVPIPRLQAWYGEPHCHYTYSGLTLKPTPFPPALSELKKIAEDLSEALFNCVLCNFYRDGKDSVSWHADNEPELGINPTIASFSFGTQRRFLIKPRKGRHKATSIMLPDNSLLIMAGDMQHHWIHQLPKTQQDVGPRINLTYRYIK